MPLGYKADRLADRVIIIIKIVDCPIKFLLELFSERRRRAAIARLAGLLLAQNNRPLMVSSLLTFI